MTIPPQPGIATNLEALQDEVQKQLGRCVLQIQQYERLLKSIVSIHRISAPAEELESAARRRNDALAKQTLGALVRELLDSCVVDDTRTDSMPGGDDRSFGIWLRVRLPAKDHERLSNDLRELVHLRNNLVHHLSEQHNLWSITGCRAALQSLADNRVLIKQHDENLQALARLLRDLVQSDAFRDSVNGTAHD
jgi:hypothetical protein